MSLRSSRDWSDLPGYISMNQRPWYMKVDDYESLRGRLKPRRANQSAHSKRAYSLQGKHWPLFVKRYHPFLGSSYRRVFGEDLRTLSEVIAGRRL